MTVMNKVFRLQLKKQRYIFILLLIPLFLMLGYLALDTRKQLDISQNGRNTLSPGSINIVNQMHGPVHIRVFATEQHVEFGDVREIIHHFIQLYQRIKPDMTVEFIDPVEYPNLAKKEGVRFNGELVIQYQDRQANLTTINEQAFTQVLMRLLRPQEKMVMALGGHGERSLEGAANYDLGEFGQQLLANGFLSESLNLTVTPDVPVTADILLIASPQIDLLPGEVEKLLEYIDSGGNLLWLVDQESLRGLLPLAEKLHLVMTHGVVIDPQAERLKAPMTFALGSSYGQHEITQGFDYVTVFPFARQIVFDENDMWRTIPLVEVAPEGWVEKNFTDAYRFDADEDSVGPITIAVALSRYINDREQRIIVVGSGHFLANTYLGNGNNLDFGMNLFNWLSGDEELIFIQPRAIQDDYLAFTETQLTITVIVFLFALPALLLLSGICIGKYRKKIS